MWFDVSEFGVRKVGGVWHHGPKRKPSSPAFRIYQTVSRASFANQDLGRQAGANASRRPRQPAQHDPAHRAVDHSLSCLWQPFVVLAQTSRQTKPSEGALHNPTAR